MKRHGRYANGFSLLEVIIATAVLASSAMVLSSLLNLGLRYGTKAEQRTLALSQAQSLMDEFLARPAASGEPTEQLTGELPAIGSYRLTVEPIEQPAPGVAEARAGGTGTASPLVRVSVEVFESGRAEEPGDEPPLCRLVRWVRRPRQALTGSTTAPTGTVPGWPDGDWGAGP